MPEIGINVGGKEFRVACQEGEEEFLRTAAAMLDAEATPLVRQIGKMPDARMLLMAGLMLADKAAGTEESMRGLQASLAERDAKIAEIEAAGKEQVEVPVVPASVTETLAELAARAEAVADAVEERAKG